MSIKRIINSIDKGNLVKTLLNRKDGEQKLIELGHMVCTNHTYNTGTMNDWSQLIERGMDVAKFEDKQASYPWEGAANFKSPLITEAVRMFGDRAKTEIMRSDKLAATKVIGTSDPEKDAASDRITEHLNYQINTELSSWRDEHTKMLYALAAQGAFFKKTFYDSTEGRNNSKIIRYPYFSINQKCENLNNGNFTDIRHYYPNDIWERQKSGFWIKDEIVQKRDQTELKEEHYEFLEQFCFYDIDDDGYEEPLIVTVHKQSKKVVRIAPRYDLDSIHVLYGGITYNLADLIKSRTQPLTENEEFNQISIINAVEDIQNNSVLVRIVPSDMITYYGFIESTTGDFLGLGFLHLLASSVKGVNKSTNALFNAGELANLQSGWLSKEHRDRKSGKFSTRAGYFKQTNITAMNLANSVLPLPFKEPSGTLLALNANLKEEIKTLSSQLNLDQMLSPNVPAASVLGVLQEGIIPTSSLLMNVISSMSKEFKIMYKLNAQYTEPLIYKSITGGDYAQDYSYELEVTPTANAMFSNQMQKIQLAQAQLDRLDLLIQIGGNPTPIVRGYYEAIGTVNIEEIFSKEMSPEEKANAEKMLQQQTKQTEALEFQNKLFEAQVQQGQMDAERRVKESDAKIEDMQVKSAQAQERIQLESDKLQLKAKEDQQRLMLDAKKLEKELKKMQSDTLLQIEKATSEEKKTELNGYLKQLEIATKMAVDMAKISASQNKPMPKEIEIEMPNMNRMNNMPGIEHKR